MSATHDSRMIKVLFAVDETGLTGASVVVIRLIRGLDRRRFAPVVFTNAANRPLISLLEQEGVPFFASRAFRDLEAIRAFETGVGLRKMAARLALIRRVTPELVKCIRNHAIGVVHANNYPMCLYCAAATRLARTPFVFHEHNLRPIGAHNWLNYKVVGLSCARTVAVSDACRRNLAAVMPLDKIRVIRNGVELPPDDARREVRASLNLQPNDRVLAIVGQPREEKGSHVFIEAAADIVRAFPDAKFVVVGYLFEDAYQRRLNRMVEELGLQRHVIFTGWREDVPALLSAIDVLVHCRLTPEPAALVLIEAMAAGKPVVVSDTGGSSEIVVHGVTGFVYPAGDAAALSRAVRTLLAEPAKMKAFGEAGRKRVEENFTVERQVRRFEALFEEIVGRDRVAS